MDRTNALFHCLHRDRMIFVTPDGNVYGSAEHRPFDFTMGPGDSDAFSFKLANVDEPITEVVASEYGIRISVGDHTTIHIDANPMPRRFIAKVQ